MILAIRGGIVGPNSDRQSTAEDVSGFGRPGSV